MTGLFGGVLGSPAQRNEHVIRTELELRRSRWRKAGRVGEGYVYEGGADLLLRHGKFYPGRECPDEYKGLLGTPTLCFQNALNACAQHPELRYCEGVYFTGHGYPTAHGFCVAPDGGVVEVTFPSDPAMLADALDAQTRMKIQPPEFWGYWGAIFDAEFVWEYGNRYSVPMFDRAPQEVQRGSERGLDMTQDGDYPVLKIPYDPTRKVVP